VEFRILGPLEVLEDCHPLALGRLKERIVLGVLLLHANEFVARERLIDELWGVAPPPTARQAVNVYISKLRKTLARDGSDPIATSEGGYRLEVDPDLLDVERMRRLVVDARQRMAAGESAAALLVLRQALELWRGPTLAGLNLESLGRDEVAQLDDVRVGVLMDRIDCDLALGHHEDALGELKVLVREHPLRERLRAQQMLALYRADRQAEALDAYQKARHALIDELGLEPSESLQRLQHAILQHDPALELPAGISAVNGAGAADAVAVPDAPLRSRRRRPPLRRRYVIPAGIAAVAAVVVLVAVLSTSGHAPKPPSSPVSYVGPDSFARIDPATSKVAWDVAAGNEPGPMAVAGNTLWLVQRGSETIEGFDLRRQRLKPPTPVPAAPYAVAADADGRAWVSDRKPVVTWVIRGASGLGTAAVPAATKDIDVPLPGAGAEAFGGGYVWVIPGPRSRSGGNDVALIDVREQKVTSSISLGRQPTAIAYGYGAAWIGTYDSRRSTAWLSIVTPGSRPQSLALESRDGAGPFAVAVGAESIWVLTSAGTLIRVDPQTRRIVYRIDMSALQPDLLAVGAGSVWTANHNGYSISRIDPAKNKVIRTIPLGSYRSIPCGLAAVHDSVYVAVGGASCDT
jgi:DNA-binding SARP family transcriptional activator/DNA-binding beta-propeller fold protein YncE